MRQLVYEVCYTRYQVFFCLWGIGSVLKYCKIPKYFDLDYSLKAQVVKLDVDAFKSFLFGSCKLSNMIDNDVAQRTVYNKFPTKFIAVDTMVTGGIVSKTQYDLDIQKLNISIKRHLTETFYSAKLVLIQKLL